jgi:RNA polymerase sigma-70 factor, ECF subfamily
VRYVDGASVQRRDEPDTEPDALLVDELRRGSPAALGAVFDRHVDAVYTYCFRRTASVVVAEDATSTVFLELWRSRARVQEHDGSLLPWLYGIARNVCRNHDRSSRRRDRAVHRLPATLSLVEPDHADAVVSRLATEQRMAEVRGAIAQLPARERDVLELVGWAGLSYQAAASVLGVPVGTVRSRLSRARSRLSTVVDAAPSSTEQHLPKDHDENS